MSERLRALRGATSVETDDKQEIIAATSELIEQMMERNEVKKGDLVSMIFTATPDLTSEFPAVAARAIGISDIPLLCAAEVDVAGAIPRVIRVLMHLYTSKGHGDLRHVYLKEARPLRTDLRQ